MDPQQMQNMLLMQQLMGQNQGTMGMDPRMTAQMGQQSMSDPTAGQSSSLGAPNMYSALMSQPPPMVPPPQSPY